jgi:hypothetical protein
MNKLPRFKIESILPAGYSDLEYLVNIESDPCHPLIINWANSFLEQIQRKICHPVTDHRPIPGSPVWLRTHRRA